jgi:CheY-like chemotaxis protein
VIPEAELRRSLQSLLLHGPYLPLTASSGKHALSLLESWDFTPGLIVVDVCSAEPSTNTFIEDLRAHPRFQSIAVLALTSEERGAALPPLEGVSVLRKPFAVADFRAAVRDNFRVA